MANIMSYLEKYDLKNIPREKISELKSGALTEVVHCKTLILNQRQFWHFSLPNPQNFGTVWRHFCLTQLSRGHGYC